MACRKCGMKQLASYPPASANELVSDESMVILEYTGDAIQFQRIRSRVHPQRFYRFGGERGSDTRRFAVYERDANWLLLNPNFVRVQLSAEDNKQLVADRQPKDRSKTPLRDALGAYFDKRVLYMLEAVGVYTIADLLNVDPSSIREQLNFSQKRVDLLYRSAQQFLAGEPITLKAVHSQAGSQDDGND